jgi:L-asparaginase
MKVSAQILLLFTSLALASPIDLSRSSLHKLFVRQDIQTPINASLPNVTIFATGGTIASQGGSNTQTTGYYIGLGVQQLVDAVPELLNISNIAGYQVSNVGSGSINKTISLTLAHMINEELAKDEIAGVVVTHGTDTLEETAFFLESTVNSSKPVIVVGAMRPATALSADGPLNLYQAVTLAGSPAGRDRGTMVSKILPLTSQDKCDTRAHRTSQSLPAKHLVITSTRYYAVFLKDFLSAFLLQRENLHPYMRKPN